ncbi:Transposon-encoded protein TnpV, partial [Dysosmobacter welbionis]
GWFSESSRRRVALRPVGGGGPGGALAAGPAAYPATGADGLPVFLLVRRGRGGRAVRRRSDRLVCPAGQ